MNSKRNEKIELKTVVRQPKEVSEFYESVIRLKKNNQENLFGELSDDFSQLVKDLSRESKMDPKALDLGYGYGNYSIKLAEMNYYVTAIDCISPDIFTRRIEKSPISDNITILEEKIETYIFNNRFDFIISKDVLHFLSKENVKRTVINCEKHTNTYGMNYFVIFTDIKRITDDNIPIVIENEANFLDGELIRLFKKVYSEWELKFIKEKYQEKNNKTGKVFFEANKITIIAKKRREKK